MGRSAKLKQQRKQQINQIQSSSELNFSTMPETIEPNSTSDTDLQNSETEVSQVTNLSDKLSNPVTSKNLKTVQAKAGKAKNFIQIMERQGYAWKDDRRAPNLPGEPPKPLL